MANSKTRILFWFTALTLVMACVPGVAAPTVPTIDPNMVGTFIAQTAHAASTQTSAAIPTSTPTATETPTPRFTDTPEPTPTSTVIFIFFSPTAVIPPTSTGNVTSNQDFSCQVMSVSPANGTSYAGRTDFDARWTVRNNGRREWDRNSIDYIYLNGDRFHKTAAYDLPNNVKVGETVNVIVDMAAPRDNGTYTTNWSLRVGSQTFCTMALTIVVR